jgi:hypothetical protein
VALGEKWLPFPLEPYAAALAPDAPLFTRDHDQLADVLEAAPKSARRAAHRPGRPARGGAAGADPLCTGVPPDARLRLSPGA